MSLIFYSELGCQGHQKEIKESITDLGLTQFSVPFKVMSCKVDGDPWIMYGEPRYNGFLTCLEDGIHEDLTWLKGGIISVKIKNVRPGVPHAMVFNPSTFKDISNGLWTNLESGLNFIALGSAGLWALKGNQVLYRKGTGYGKGFQGTAWIPVQGAMKQISVGDNVVWGINKENQVQIRSQLSESNPTGVEWTQLDSNMATQGSNKCLGMCSVGPGGTCWSIDDKGSIYRRAGAKKTNPIGTKWQQISGELVRISVGQAGVWGINSKNEILYRDGSYGLPEDAEGNGWTKVDGKMIWISSGTDMVWAISADKSLWYRGGLSAFSPSGNNWFLVELGPQHNIKWNQIEAVGNELVGLNADNLVVGNPGASPAHLSDGNGVNIYEGAEHFRMFDVQDKPSSFTVLSGSWIAYGGKNFTGPCIYHFEDENISNDPAIETEDQLKTWQESIGSIRPMITSQYKPVSVEVDVDWDSAEVGLKREEVRNLVDSNHGDEFSAPSWNKVQNIPVTIQHRFDLGSAEPEASDLVFLLNNVPKTNFGLSQGGSKVETKLEFRQEVGGYFTFESALTASRTRTRTETVKLPPTLPPHSGLQVSVICHRLVVKAPFTAHFTKGTNKWSVNGSYTGMDGTTLKIKTQDIVANGLH